MNKVTNTLRSVLVLLCGMVAATAVVLAAFALVGVDQVAGRTPAGVVMVAAAMAAFFGTVHVASGRLER